MKHAYLILAHNEPKILRILVSLLDDVDNDIYIHIDAKSDFLQFADIGNVCEKSKCVFLNKRFTVHWGGFSIIKTEMLLFDYAIKNGNYNYFHLMSGVDLPIKSISYIKSFFEENNGYEFIGFDKIITDNHAQDRIRFRYLFIDYNPRCLSFITPRLNGLSLRLQNWFKLYREPFVEIKHGSQWCSLSCSFVKYLLSKTQIIEKIFKYSLCPDELYKQTILWNSPFREKIYSIDDNLKSSLYEIEWGSNPGLHPFTFTMKDKERLMMSDQLYARKFSSKHLDIVSYICENLVKHIGNK